MRTKVDLSPLQIERAKKMALENKILQAKMKELARKMACNSAERRKLLTAIASEHGITTRGLVNFNKIVLSKDFSSADIKE